MSDSLRPHELQHARPPCPSPTPRVYPNSCPLSRWCHLAISSSVVPFSSCPQSLQASGSFPMSQCFAWGGQSTGVSASVLPMNTQDWFPLELTELILCLRTGGNTYQLGVKSVFFFFSLSFASRSSLGISPELRSAKVLVWKNGERWWCFSERWLRGEPGN